jgi:hypothetical protein
MQVPSFLKLEDNALVFNEDNKEFVFFVPENFFNNTSKNAIAEENGQYVSMIGLCDWAIYDEHGKRGEVHPFNFPTMFLCKPYKIEKVKNMKLDKGDPGDYRLLRFAKGDQVVSQVRVPQLIENVELFYQLAVITAKIPNTIPYDKIWNIFLENMELNGYSYGLNAQLFGIVTGELCRDPNNVARPFRMTDMKDMNAYKLISIKLIPNYISPYTSIISENWDESLISAILMKDKEDLPYSPLEKIVTM